MLVDTDLPTDKRFLNLEGRSFERLTVKSYAGRNEHGHKLWNCECSCGNKVIVWTCSLTSGHTKSCGCLNRERLKAGSQKTHGNSKKGSEFYHEYILWKEMRRRCFSPTHKFYADYGGRGISVCDRWANSFEDFLSDLLNGIGRKPSKQHSIDRINNDGNYEPGNVRWATKVVQARNKRSNRMITVDGKTQTMSAWCEELGMSQSSVRQRLSYGWSEERAVTTKRIFSRN